MGLAHPAYGQLTLGRQYDQMTGALIRFHPAFYGGIYGFTPGDADRVAGAWLNNQITYASPAIGGFKFNAQVSAADIKTQHEQNAKTAAVPIENK